MKLLAATEACTYHHVDGFLYSVHRVGDAVTALKEDLLLNRGLKKAGDMQLE